jgi:hypothetical protein
MVHEQAKKDIEACYGGEDGVKRIRPQVKAAFSLLAVNRSFRIEVAPLVFPNLMFKSNLGPEPLLGICERFTQPMKRMLLRVSFPMGELTNRRTSDMRARLRAAFEGMTDLQHMFLSDCTRNKNAATTGTVWGSRDLHCLRLIRQILPQLIHSRYYTESRNVICAHLSTTTIPEPREIALDVDAEYQSWLEAFRQRRTAKKAQQD